MPSEFFKIFHSIDLRKYVLNVAAYSRPWKVSTSSIYIYIYMLQALTSHKPVSPHDLLQRQFYFALLLKVVSVTNHCVTWVRLHVRRGSYTPGSVRNTTTEPVCSSLWMTLTPYSISFLPHIQNSWDQINNTEGHPYWHSVRLFSVQDVRPEMTPKKTEVLVPCSARRASWDWSYCDYKNYNYISPWYKCIPLEVSAEVTHYSRQGRSFYHRRGGVHRHDLMCVV
jgi:hypothetical protein